MLSGRNLSPWHFEFFNWFMFPAYRALLSRENVLLFNNSRTGAEDYARWLRLPSQSIDVVRNAIDTERFQPPSDTQRIIARKGMGLSLSARVVVGAFRLSAEKRPLLWVDAAAAIHRRLPDTVFVLFGGGPLFDSVRQHASKLGLGDHIIYGGTATDIRVPFAAADLVMLTSAQEGTPNVLIEAQALGIPVLTPPAYGAEEAVEDDVTGLVVRGETSSAIADAAVRLLNDVAFRECAREMGPQFVRRRFGLNRMTEETLALYRKLGWTLSVTPDAIERRDPASTGDSAATASVTRS